MKLSYLAPIFDQSIPVNREIVDQFNLDKNCHLYGILNPEQRSLVLSGVPVENWASAWKLTIYTSDRPGTLAAISGKLSERDVNMLTTWSAATGGLGQGYMTAIVEFPEQDSTSKGFAADFVEKLEKECGQCGLLMKSKLFSEGGLKPVRLMRLSILGALKKVSAPDYRFEVPVNDWTLDFRKTRAFAMDVGPDGQGGDRIPKMNVLSKLGLLGRVRGGASAVALLSPDTEERVILLSVLGSEINLRRISFDMKVLATAGNFKGYFEKALDVIREQDLNIFSSRNMTTFKSTRAESGNGSGVIESGKGVEEAEFSFLVDINGSRLADSSLKEQAGILAKEFHSKLEGYAKSTGGRVWIGKRGRIVSVADHELLWPRCFLATNAKKDDILNLEYARKLFFTLLHLGFHPVNVDITQQRTVFEDVVKLLKACPLLISLHLPEVKNTLERNNELVGSSTSEELFCPSDWVIFEESYFAGLGRKVFKMRHSDVRRPSYTPGEVEFVFKDFGEFDQMLKSRLKMVITRHMTEKAWKVALQQSGRFASDLDTTAMVRDLHGEFTADVEKAQE